MKRVNSILAARAGVRQVEAAIRADRAADAASAAVMRVWKEILTLLRNPPNWLHAKEISRRIFAGLLPAVAGDTAAHLGRTAAWGRRTAKANLTEAIPPRLLHYAAARKTLREGREDVRDSDLSGRLLCGRHDGHGSCDPVSAALGAQEPGHLQGDVRLGARPDGVHASAGDGTRRLIEADLPTVADLLFPQFTAEEVDAVIYASGWIDRLFGATRLAAPETLAGILSAGLAGGKSPREIARDLLPAVQGVQSTARRVARTESMRVAHAAQMDCHKQLGDLVIGYMVHATLDHWTRPWHASRSGQVYYLDPRPGQKSMRQCPHPPDEAEDPRERPAKAPFTAWNCRCFLTPVLRDPGATDAEMASLAPVGPDPLVFSDWFAGADERRRRLAVGAKRYSLLHDALGSDPAWGDFLDPRTGDLLPYASLKAETPLARHERAAKVRAMLAARRADLAEVGAKGFIAGEG